MKRWFAAAVLTMLSLTPVLAQEPAPPAESTYVAAKPAANTVDGLVTPPVVDPRNAVILKSGTKMLLKLVSPINTKSAKPGDPVYTQTNFPVVLNGRVIVPQGTYVQGTIVETKRAGRVKGRATMQIRFTTLIFPNGYTIMLPGTLDNAPGDGVNKVKNSESRVEAPGQTGKDVGTVVKATSAGAETGAIIAAASDHNPLGGLGIGAAGGMAIGLGEVLLTRGPDLTLAAGASLEMSLERDLTIDLQQARAKPE